MRVSKQIFLLLVLLFLGGCAIFEPLTVEDVKQCTTTEDDEMSNRIIFSSLNCDRRITDILGITSDYFILATKHKIFGSTSYQVYAHLVSNQESQPYSASYLQKNLIGREVLVKVNGDRVSATMQCAMYLLFSCVHYEQFAFPLKKRYLKLLSSNFEELSKTKNREKFRIFRRSGGYVDFTMSINELVGIYRLVENY